MERGHLNMPKSHRDRLPHVLITDGGFELTKKLLTPFRRNQATSSKRKVFNYRLCRARRLVKNVFGILTHCFRSLALDSKVKKQFIIRLMLS